MSENIYLEQYLNQVILTRYLHNWLMEALNEVKEQKNAGQLKKVHELIDRVEKSGKKLALYEKVFLELMVTDYKYINVQEKVEVKGKTYYRVTYEHKVMKMHFTYSDIDDFGKTVFLTKSEAEKKLKEMEKNF